MTLKYPALTVWSAVLPQTPYLSHIITVYLLLLLFFSVSFFSLSLSLFFLHLSPWCLDSCGEGSGYGWRWHFLCGGRAVCEGVCSSVRLDVITVMSVRDRVIIVLLFSDIQ